MEGPAVVRPAHQGAKRWIRKASGRLEWLSFSFFASLLSEPSLLLNYKLHLLSVYECALSPSFNMGRGTSGLACDKQLVLRGQTKVSLTYLYVNKHWSINLIRLKMKRFCSLYQIHNNLLLPHTQIKSTKPNQRDQSHRFLTFREILISIQQGNLM